MLLIKARKFQHRGSHKNGEVEHCVLPHYNTMKSVLNHMRYCKAGKSCTFPLCSSPRKIVKHCKHREVIVSFAFN